jgi:hypothetical protein
MRLRPLELARPTSARWWSRWSSPRRARPSRPSSGPERRDQGICYSQLGWCPLDRAARIPVGISCYCILPDRRTIAGITSPLYYQGHVGPYFNLNPPPVPTLIK